MNIKSILLISAAIFALGFPAYAADKETYETDVKIEKDANGNYNEKDKTIKTDATGTTTSYEKDAKVSVDTDGNTNKSTTTKSVTDPKGLFNKTTVTTSNTEKVKDGVAQTGQDVKVNGKTVESTAQTIPQ
jgi:hypothetical protein